MTPVLLLNDKDLRRSIIFSCFADVIEQREVYGLSETIVRVLETLFLNYNKNRVVLTNISEFKTFLHEDELYIVHCYLTEGSEIIEVLEWVEKVSNYLEVENCK